MSHVIIIKMFKLINDSMIIKFDNIDIKEKKIEWILMIKIFYVFLIMCFFTKCNNLKLHISNLNSSQDKLGLKFIL
jgi:hypothetical protein